MSVPCLLPHQYLGAIFFQDLSIGKELDIYGRTFLLVDANNSTRKYCSDICKRALGTWTLDLKHNKDSPGLPYSVEGDTYRNPHVTYV